MRTAAESEGRGEIHGPRRPTEKLPLRLAWKPFHLLVHNGEALPLLDGTPVD